MSELLLRDFLLGDLWDKWLCTCLSLSELVQEVKKKNTGRDFNIGLVGSQPFAVQSTACVTPSVPARYFHHSHPVSPGHAEMVTAETREGKDLAWRRTGQADEAGHFASLGRDHSLVCIEFCFLLFLKLVPSVAFGGHALNISYALWGHAISYQVKGHRWLETLLLRNKIFVSMSS